MKTKIHKLCWVVALIGACLTATARADVLSEVRKSGELKVCIWPEYFGISYQNPKTRSLQGIDIDMSAAFAAYLSVKLKYVLTNFAKVMQDVESGVCDIAMMGVGVTPDRQKLVDFSAPYLRSDIMFVTTRSNKVIHKIDDIDQPGIVIAVQKGTLMENFLAKNLKHAKLKVTTAPGEREKEVELGRADAFATDFPYSQRMLLNTDWARVIAPTKPWELTDYAYAVKKGEAKWLAEINAFLSKAKSDGSLEAAAKRNNLLPILVKD
ncbi:substrate-binding periplasmic protein [Zwartia panacis]|uniref:substrate-binding periplasmic protein n=1 Tax=Zwartia panacis TaxID=2683345 RepID=UPI0025B31FE4|nr:ABC transporter substrate-binding protein [Zwartia panacis]MDN4017786.1 ABC transporter substrate-binding protein [Zwartia panacis]